MYIQVRDNNGIERFIDEEQLESAIASGEVVAFRRSDGWISVPCESYRGASVPKAPYSGQERRRGRLSLKKMFQETDGD